MIETQDNNTRDIPVWLTGLVLILCVSGGSYMVWWYLRDSPKQVATIPQDQLANISGPGGRNTYKGTLGNGGGSQRPMRDPQRDLSADGIQQWGRNSYRAKIGNVAMTVSYSSNGRAEVNPMYLAGVRTAEEAELGVLRMSLIQDPNWRQTLNVTDEQVKKLRNVPPQLSMKLEPIDRTRLTDLWKTYKDGTGDKAAAEKAVLTALDEIGKKNLQATKDYEAERARRIREALTPEQIQQYRNSGGKPGAMAKPAAAPQPAAAPSKEIGHASTDPGK